MAGILLYAFAVDYSHPWTEVFALTNWCRWSVAASYFCLWLAHYLNGDYEKDKTHYIPPKSPVPPFDTVDPTILECCKPWKWGTLLYEWQLSISAVVFIAFFFVEIPMVVL